jgi:hypothetical protein
MIDRFGKRVENIRQRKKNGGYSSSKYFKLMHFESRSMMFAENEKYDANIDDLRRRIDEGGNIYGSKL